MKIDMIESENRTVNLCEATIERYNQLSEKIDIINEAFHKNLRGLISDEELERVLKY